MGICVSHESELDNKGNKGHQEELLLFIRENLLRLEENILKLRKEDVHYRMTRLMFMLNAMRELTPVIKTIEDGGETLDYLRIKEAFEEIFKTIWRNERDRYTASFYVLKDVMEGKVGPVAIDGKTPNPTLTHK